MKRSTLTAALFFAGVSVTHAGETVDCPRVGDAHICPHAQAEYHGTPIVTIQGVDHIGSYCPNGSLQTGHTESNGAHDYRWVWDDCPKKETWVTPSLDGPTTGCSGWNDCLSHHDSPKGTLVVPHLPTPIVDGDTVTITSTGDGKGLTRSFTITGKITITGQDK